MAFLEKSPRAAGWLRVALFSFAWINVLLWLICLLRLAIADRFTTKFLPSIPYHYGPSPGDGTDALFEASTYTLSIVCEFFIPPLLASLAIYACEYLPHGELHFSKTMAKVNRVLGWQVPGRRFWFWWCGGLSLGELLFYLGVLGAVASWLEYYLYGQYDYYNAVADTIDISRSELHLEAWGLCLGLALYPCFWLLFWPVAHDSFLNHLLGLPWQNMIKYHRWIGHVVMWVMTGHGVAYFALWFAQDDFWPQFSSWKDSIPFFPGSLAWIAGLALQITSLYYIRRKFFDLFYKVHIVGFLLCVLFSCIHYARSWFYFLPGLVPWAADLIFRFAQGASITTITSARLSDDKTVVSWEMTLEDGETVEPLHDYLINVPSISRWGWHPFTIAHTCGNKVCFNTKAYGSFTTELMTLLEKGLPIPVRVQGPIGIPATEKPWLKYPVLVCITGGIGISPVLAVLNSLIDHRRSEKGAAPAGGPQRVIVVWSARHKAEFTILDESIISTANEENGWLSVALHYTGANIERASSIKPDQLKSEPIKPLPADLGDSTDTSDTGSDTGKGGCPLGLDDMLRFNWFSPLGFSLARPVQPKWASTLHKIIVLLLVNLGGFCGLSLATVYWAEGNAIGQFVYDGSTDFFYWKYGALMILGGFIGGLGLPVFAVHTWAAWRYFKAVRRSRSTAPSDAQAAIERVVYNPALRRSDVRPTARYASTLVGGRVGFVESGAMLDIGEHRPDIRATLQEAVVEAAELAGGADVGVYVAGPVGMVNAAKRAAADLNSARKRGAPALHFHQETWEL